VRLHRLLLLLPIVLVAALLPGSSIAADPIVLKGTVGPGFVITLRDASNNTVKRVLPGDYVIQVDDRSVDHNFHFKGPGVDMKTEVETTGPAVWSVTLVDGKYTFVCDPHAGIMNGVLNVGVAPPPPTKLSARVGPKKTISLKTASGAAVKELKAGAFRIAVTDSSKADNFHLIGPGVNKKTAVKKKGSVVWNVTLRAGKYAFRSDPTKKLRRSFSVAAA
jgi:hypothetical protein